MAQIITGSSNGSDKKIAVIVSKFNEFVTQKLLDGTIACLQEHGVKDDAIDVAWVPGAFELPLAAQKMAAAKKYHAVICVGAVIRGETAHFDYVASEAARGIAQVALDTHKPVLFGVLTTDTVEQALTRAGSKEDNKGWTAARAALEMCDLLDKL